MAPDDDARLSGFLADYAIVKAFFLRWRDGTVLAAAILGKAALAVTILWSWGSAALALFNMVKK